MVRPNAPQVQLPAVRERFEPRGAGYWIHPGWEADFPWLVQGTTGRRPGEARTPWDFALFGESPDPAARDRWERLGRGLGFETVVHSRQVHGNLVLSPSLSTAPTRSREDPGMPDPASLLLGPDADGHISGSRGVLLGVTVADCVPVFLVDPVTRAIGLLHAGWRGAVAGILEEGIQRLRTEFAVDPANLHVHLGPGICGDCFEVGPEVHLAMGLPDPGSPRPVDLRGHLASRGVASGVGPGRMTQSAWCTLCGDSPFYSHRRGESGRQVGFLGIRNTGVSSSSPTGGGW
jgi:YfiH family protein